MSELVVGSLKGLAANGFEIEVAAGSTLDLSAGAVLPAGSVVQVVHGTITATTSTTSNTAQPIGLSATITPRSASNKVLVFVNLPRLTVNNSFNNAYINAWRNSIGGVLVATATLQSNAGAIVASISMNTLDSPGTLSPVTYTVSFQSSVSGNLITLEDKQNITLIEVAG